MNKKTTGAVSAKSGAKRQTLRDKRASVRGKLRKAAPACGCLVVLAAIVFAMGCASATPSSKSQVSKACGNTIIVNVNLSVATNAVASAASPVSVTLSDLIGTQVQSADTEGGETVSQTATPTNQNGLTGDKPIETVGDVVKAGLTGGTSSAIKTATNVAGLTGLSANGAASSAKECVGEACEDTQ